MYLNSKWCTFYNQNNNSKTGKRIIQTESLRQPEPLLVGEFQWHYSLLIFFSFDILKTIPWTGFHVHKGSQRTDSCCSDILPRQKSTCQNLITLFPPRLV